MAWGFFFLFWPYSLPHSRHSGGGCDLHRQGAAQCHEHLQPKAQGTVVWTRAWKQTPGHLVCSTMHLFSRYIKCILNKLILKCIQCLIHSFIYIDLNIVHAGTFVFTFIWCIMFASVSRDRWVCLTWRWTVWLRSCLVPWWWCHWSWWPCSTSLAVGTSRSFASCCSSLTLCPLGAIKDL